MADEIDPRRLDRLYCSIMEEIKARNRLIEGTYGGKYKLPDFARIEFTYLQLRMISELIALACIAAHGEISEVRTSKIMKAYEPGKILKHLDSLHPVFFPIPVESIFHDNGSYKGITPKEDHSGLTKSEVPKLHALCANFLHRGRIKSYTRWIEADFKKAAEWQNKIIGLLNQHIIVLSDKKRISYVVMQHGEAKKVHLFNLSSKDYSSWPDWFEDMRQLQE